MLKNLIGNTPMVKIDYKFKDRLGSVYAKLEYYNYTGSIKDRLAFYIIKKAKEDGLLKEGQPIVEATSGNTGISLAAVGAFYGHPVHIFMPEWASKERVEIMKLYGANVYLVSKDVGFKGAIAQSKELAKKIGGFLTEQFDNELNVRMHYEWTAQEIKKQLSEVDAFVSGVGTGGTLIGNALGLKEKFKDIKIIAMEPEKMPLLSNGKIIGNHKIEGIGDDFIPGLYDKNLIDQIILINDDDAINMTKMLAEKLGLGVGISSGANFLASVLSGYGKVATIFADDFKKYLSTDLVKTFAQEKFISNEVELLGMEII